MSASEFDSRDVYHRVLGVKCAVCQFVRLLHMHDFIDRTIYLKKAGIDQRSVTDTSDDSHLGTTNYMGVKPSVFYQIFNTRDIFF